MNNKLSILYTTVQTIEDAKNLANLVLCEHLAICINIIPNGESMYLWDNQVEEEQECYMLFKTNLEKIEQLEQFILKKHPYEIPVTLKINPETSKDFLNYLNKTLS